LFQPPFFDTLPKKFQGYWIHEMKLEIKLDPQDIEEIARRLASEISGFLMEMESRIRKSQIPVERPPAEKVWKMPDGEWWNDKQVARVTVSS
jgi:hypothetical protein